MITGISSRTFRPHTMTVGMRQQVVARTNPVMSKQVARKVTMILCAGIFVVFVFSQFMRWQIVASVNQLEELQAVRTQAGSENISLLAKRAQLVSKDYIVEQVGTKFQLFVPVKDQIQRL
ncbi:MAG: hypothetical protein OEM01_10560 [Desulfobulbaceae bacterium]|nr:hypothetical protein [Desulfobulbaceae bacterium]